MRPRSHLARWLKAHPFLTKIAVYAAMFVVYMGLFHFLPQPIPLISLTIFVALLATAVGYCIWRPSGDGTVFGIILFVGAPLVLVLSLCVIVEWRCYLGAI